jgi:hypothetical protein
VRQAQKFHEFISPTPGNRWLDPQAKGGYLNVFGHGQPCEGVPMLKGAAQPGATTPCRRPIVNCYSIEHYLTTARAIKSG